MASLPLVISGALPLNAMISAHSTKAPAEASAAWDDITSVQHVASVFEVTSMPGESRAMKSGLREKNGTEMPAAAYLGLQCRATACRLCSPSKPGLSMISCVEAAGADVEVSATLPRSTAFDHCDQTCDTQSAVQELKSDEKLREKLNIIDLKELSVRSSGRTSVSVKLFPP